MSTDRRYGGLSAEERRSTRRSQLLKAVRALASTDGLAKITVKTVSTRAGLTERYFYESFTNLGALLDAMFEEIASEMAAKVIAAAAMAPGDLRERMKSAVDIFLDELASDPVVGLAFTELQTDESLMRHKAALIKTLADLALKIAPVMAPGLPEDDTRLSLAVFYAAGGGIEVTTRWLDGSIPMTRDDLLETGTDLLIAVVKGAFGDVQS